MRWIVGLDLRPDGRGAIATAGWLARHASDDVPQRFVGVHVLPQARVAVRDDVLDELTAEASKAAKDAIDEAAPGTAFERIDVVPGESPEMTLAAAAGFYGADGLIIGRHGPRDEPAFVRLGRVARRLVRQLPKPVMVVPPDYGAAEQTSGPIVVLTDLQHDARTAARVADRLAKGAGLELVVVHVLRNPQAAFDPVASERTVHDKPAIESWLADCGIEGAQAMTASSDVVDAALHIAKSRDASMIVCGSRRLSLGERTYLSSTGTDLARYALCPVLVVPPTQPTP